MYSANDTSPALLFALYAVALMVTGGALLWLAVHVSLWTVKRITRRTEPEHVTHATSLGADGLPHVPRPYAGRNALTPEELDRFTHNVPPVKRRACGCAPYTEHAAPCRFARR